jgi:hypothetical protein
MRVILAVLPVVLFMGCGEAEEASISTSNQAGNSPPTSTSASKSSNTETDSKTDSKAEHNPAQKAAPVKEKAAEPIYDASHAPIAPGKLHECSGTFVDSEGAHISKVFAALEPLDNDSSLNVIIECVASWIEFPVTVKSGQVSCHDVQRAVSNTALCKNPKQLGTSQEFKNDLSALFNFDASDRVNMDSQQDQVCPDVMRVSHSGTIEMALVGKTEKPYGNLQNDSLFSIFLEFQGVTRYTRYYYVEDTADIICPGTLKPGLLSVILDDLNGTAKAFIKELNQILSPAIMI